MSRRCLILLLLWLVAVCASAGVPQRPRFRIVGPPQGLPSTDIKALAHDRDGYVWIGTADGLARYDGVGMRIWRNDPEQIDGLPGNNVQALLVDANDRVWVAVEGAGISVLDATRRRFSRIHMQTHPLLASDDIWTMARQGDAIWLGTFGGGVTRIDARGQLRTWRKGKDGLPSDTVLSLVVDARGVLWVGTTAGLARFESEHFVPVPLPGEEGAQLIYSLAMQTDGLWVGGAQGVWQQVDGHWAQPAWSPMFERPNAMLSMVTPRAGEHWIGSQRGLWHQQGTAPPEPVPLGAPEIPRMISSLLGEPGGGLWTPILGRGLGHLRSDWRRLAELRGSEDGLQGAMYRALGKSADGGVWMGGLGGRVEHMDARGQVAPLTEEALDRLRNVKPVAIAEDRSQRLWLAHRNGLIRIGRDGAIDEWTADDTADAVPAGQIGWLQFADDGTQWLAAPGGGVQQRDPDTGHVLLDLSAGAASGLGDADIEAMVLGPSNAPWLAGANGVLRFDPDREHFMAVTDMGNARAFALAFDGSDRVWLQRLAGLEEYRREGDGWRRVSSVDAHAGMPAVAAAAMVVDAAHRVWLTTSRGLYRWDPLHRNLWHPGAQDEASSEEYLERAAVLRDDGVLVAATADGGLRLIDTRMPDAAPLRPVLRFDAVAVRRNGGWQELPLHTGLTLAASDRELRIRARLLAFDDPSGNRYWSYLDGFDRAWVALGSAGERVFTALPPGHYRVRVRARDAAGNVASEQQLAFIVPPPWWRSTWALLAYVLVVLTLFALLAWAYRVRLQRQHAWQLAEHKRDLAEQASEAKSRFLATLGHEVRTPMTGVLGMAELLQSTPLDPRQRGHVDAIHRAGGHLLRLVNDALDLARIEAGKLELNPADFDLRSLLDEVTALMAPVAERKGLRFDAVIAPDLPLALHGDRTRVQQILLNLLGNAIKFTEHGEVRLEAGVRMPQGIRFAVIDTGPGLSAEQQARLFRRFEQGEGARTAARYGGSGLGLAISQELAAAMGGRIEVESALGKGTRFIVELPLDRAMTAHRADPAASMERSVAAESLHLLLVEDDPIVAEVLLGLLRERGHAVTHAAHGLAALSEAALQRFDAALLDLDLPGLDGLTLAQMLRTQGFTAPLLAVTARSDGEAEAQAYAAGFAAFLRKPVSGEQLADALRLILRR